MSHGQLALVLHAHLPFVRHPEHEEFFEEDWLFEAITETYIPLIAMMQRLVDDGVPFKLTMSLTPPLCAMLQDELLQTRYVRHIERLIELAQREIERNRDHAELEKLSRHYCDWFVDTRRRFVEEWNRDLVSAFRQLRDAGVLEIIGCAATHGLLPLLTHSPEAMRAQVMIGRDAYREAFGADPAGFWLPECAYTPGIDKVLQEANVRWFMLDAHGLMLGKPKPRRAIYAPCFTPAGPAAFARDPESSRQVWSAEAGYPGEPAYRDFYRDVGFDLPPDYVWPGGKTPRFTGIKYHRITGRDVEKQLYDRRWAVSAAHAHAEHFLESRRRQLHDLGRQKFEPIVVMPFDAELFGHWWYEGPLFLECFIRKAAAPESGIELTTPTEYLRDYPTHETVQPAASSWGEDGYWSVWLNAGNSWIYPRVHSAARRMTEAARMHAPSPTALAERLLKQLARELLLAQASDWAFLIKTGTAKHYAAKRTNDHLERFDRLHAQLRADAVDDQFLSDCEWRDNIFPNLEWRHYL
jgi:1,4-alpha-glucan branching enzyme